MKSALKLVLTTFGITRIMFARKNDVVDSFPLSSSLECDTELRLLECRQANQLLCFKIHFLICVVCAHAHACVGAWQRVCV